MNASATEQWKHGSLSCHRCIVDVFSPKHAYSLQTARRAVASQGHAHEERWQGREITQGLASGDSSALPWRRALAFRGRLPVAAGSRALAGGVQDTPCPHVLIWLLLLQNLVCLLLILPEGNALSLSFSLLALLIIQSTGLRRWSSPTMPSADFCHPILPPLDESSQGQGGRPPWVMRVHLRIYARCIYSRESVQVLDFELICSLIPHGCLYAVPVRRASALPVASFEFHRAMNTPAVRLPVPPVGPGEDSHLLMNAPCQAHHSTMTSVPRS